MRRNAMAAVARSYIIPHSIYRADSVHPPGFFHYIALFEDAVFQDPSLGADQQPGQPLHFVFLVHGPLTVTLPH
jgi:hypothetical protein